MELEQNNGRRGISFRRIFFACIVVIVLIGTVFAIFLKYTGIMTKKIKINNEESHIVGGNEKKETKKIEEEYDSTEIGTLTGSLGFSIKYPYKLVQPMWGDDEKLQVAFMYYPEELFGNEDVAEKVDLVGDNFYVKNVLALTVSDKPKENEDVALWMQNYLKDEDSSKREGMQVISSKTEDIMISGVPGKIVIQEIKTIRNQKETHNLYHDIFIFKDGLAYHFEQVFLPENFQFPSGFEGMPEYYEKEKAVFAQIIGSFEFDNSKVTSISVPKKQLPELSGEAKVRRERLLVALRKPPFFNEKLSHQKISSSERCAAGSTSKKDASAYKKELRPSSGMYFSMDDDKVQLHGYDNDGGHTGPIPTIPVYAERELMEEQARGINSLNFGSDGYGLVIHENIEGRIEIVGKDFAFESFEISGDGNSCVIAEMMLPVTPYSVYTLPISVSGDFGPLSCDIDGDGIEDFKWSLLHPLFDEKYVELGAVLEDMKNAEQMIK